MLLQYVCENCGKTFSSPARRRRTRKRFCSPKCSRNFLQSRVTRTCPVCGKDFEIPLGPASFRITCSAPCAQTWNSKPLSEAPRLATLRRTLLEQASKEKPGVCELCGEDSVVELATITSKASDRNKATNHVAILCSGCHVQYEKGTLGADELLKRLNRLIYGVRTKKIKFVVDSRGRLCEVFTQKDLIWRAPAHIYLTTVDYEVTKAWHLHQRQTDNFFCVFGCIQLGLFDVRPESPTFGRLNEFVMNDSNPLVVQIPPGVLHGFKGLSIPHAMVLNMSDHIYRAEEPDEIRVSPHAGSEQTADLKRLEIPLQTVPYNWARKDG